MTPRTPPKRICPMLMKVVGMWAVAAAGCGAVRGAGPPKMIATARNPKPKTLPPPLQVRATVPCMSLSPRPTTTSPL